MKRKVSLILVATLLSALLMPLLAINVSAALPNDKLIAQYSFDEIVRGSVVDGMSKYHGQVVKGVTIADDATRGKVASFDGTTGYILLPEGIMKGLTDITISAWYNYTSDKAWARVFDFGSNTSQYFMLTPISGSTSTILAENKNEPTVAGGEILSDVKDPPTNKWVHVAITVTGGKFSLYVNGDLADEMDAVNKPGDLGNTVQNYLGKSQFADPLFTGLMDDVAVYSTALNAAQIKELMKVKFTTPANAITTVPAEKKAEIANVISTRDDKMISRYTFNENVGGKVIDDINGNNGTLFGDAGIINDSTRGSVLSLDGKTGYVKLPDSIMTAASNEITITAWYNYTGDFETKWTRIIDFGNDSNQYIMVTPVSGAANTVVMANKNEPTVSGEEQAISFDDPPIGTWTHMAITVGKGKATLYLNGVMADSIDATIMPADFGPTTQNYIGKSQWPDPLFQGMIDDVLIYTRVLSADEIKAVMKEDFSGLTYTPTESAPVENTPAAADTTAPAASPKTGDTGLVTLFALMSACVLSLKTILKKRG